MEDVREQMPATRDLLEAARRDAVRALQRLEKAESKATARQAIVEAYTGGETHVPSLAESFGVSPETVRSALKAAGVYTPARRGKVSPEKRELIVKAIKDNPNVAEQALYWGLSAATIRTIGQEAGLIEKGPPRVPRSDEMMRDIEAVELKLREEFGGGFSALGTALDHWRKKQPKLSVREAIDLKTAGASSTPDGAPWE